MVEYYSLIVPRVELKLNETNIVVEPKNPLIVPRVELKLCLIAAIQQHLFFNRTKSGIETLIEVVGDKHEKHFNRTKSGIETAQTSERGIYKKPLIVPRVELKRNFHPCKTWHCGFNRTKSGIETVVNFPFSFSFSALIVPRVELKRIADVTMRYLGCFNRTKSGIETRDRPHRNNSR